MKATEQYVPVVLLIMLYKMLLTFESEDEVLESKREVLFTGTGFRQYFPVTPFVIQLFLLEILHNFTNYFFVILHRRKKRAEQIHLLSNTCVEQKP